ncbi:H/ACA ribonucleoprotein complex non-core subunit NAF1-like [Cornus florida]|uniref:H/ACA ribonucleoprotein complex non-core subunit NAF1-like n=1 Tax=Cornus florida TaxID=4283 RepID=UPI0028A073A7|nr:H/ACA ribonucleoprotein complex non-core subunit NAF1-like [Cornus florida]
MVGFLFDSNIEDDLNSHLSKLRSPDDQFDLSIPELDSFADSFLDLDSIKDWMAEVPDPNLIQPKSELDTVGTEGVEFGVAQKGIKMAADVSLRETTVGERFGNESEKMENFGSSIEEEMGKFSLEEGLGGSVVADGNGAKSGEVTGINGTESKSVDFVCVNGNGVKSGETVSIDGKGDSSGDESDSSSESESESSSSSSSASSSSSEDDEVEQQDVEGEEEEDKDEEDEREKGKLTRDTDVEEGEIRDSDGGEMITWSDGEDDEDDGGGGSVTKGPIRSKNELKDLPPVPPVNVTLQPYHQTLPVGFVLSIIGSQVIVEGAEKHNPLNEGSILWITGSRSPLGLVDEIFGPVKNPYYMVRYNSDNEVPVGIQQGTLISFVPEFVDHVLKDPNLYKKGYDASGENDEEMSDEAEFSDDEKEAEYRRMLKMTKRGGTNDQKHGNTKKGRKFKNRGGTWKNGQPSTSEELDVSRKNGQPSASEGLVDVCKLPPNQNQHCIAPFAVPLDRGNFPHSFGQGQGFNQGQGFTGGPGCVPPFLQLAQAPGFVTPSNGVFTNGMPCQQQQGTVLPNGYPTNSMPWLQQTHLQQSYQMPFPNRMPFQQQFNPSQMLPSNLVLPGQQSYFSAGPAYAPWPPYASQSGFNQTPFGMELRNQHPCPPINVEEQGAPSSGMQKENNCDLQPPPVNPGHIEASQNFNQAVYLGRGGRQYPRGGGRFGRGRGRGRAQQQSK